MEITFLDETNSVGETKIKEIEGLLQFAAGHLELPDDTEMSVTFMDNAAIQEINREYRGKDMPTDVISFAFEEETDEELSIIFDEALEELPRDLGDIMISIERAKEQAAEYGHLRVVCALSLMIAIFCPTTRFSSVDFPTFGRPTIATKPDLCVVIVVPLYLVF